MWYFYRVENSEGDGPYNNYWGICSLDWRVGPHTVKTGRPRPGHDETLPHSPRSTSRDAPYGSRFGFVTLGQLQAWFRPEELRRLETLGFHIRRVRGETIWESNHQVCFLPD